MSVLVLVGSIGAIIAGASAGADDLSSGVFREVVVTGRSRLALFGARIPGGLAFALSFAVVAFAISAVVSATANGELPAPSLTLVVESGLWVFAELAFYFVLGLGLASLTDIDVVPELNRSLVEAGIPVRRLEPMRASLEERFLAITSRLEDTE